MTSQFTQPLLDDDTRRLLADSADKYLTGEYNFDDRQATATTEVGFSRQHWRRFAELGWLGIPFAPELGGLGGSIFDCLALCRAFGKVLVLEPYISACTAGHILQQSSNAAPGQRLLPRVVSGELLPCLAHNEADSRGNAAYVATRAIKTNDGYQIHGNKQMVMNAAQADVLIVSARLSGNVAEEDGIALFLVDADDPGLLIEPYTSVDDHRAANIHMDLRLKPSALLDEHFDTLRQALHMSTLMHLAEGLGAMEVLLDSTVAYTRMRKQFGAPISSFQAVRHRLADMYIAYHKVNNLFSQKLRNGHGGHVDAGDIALLKAQFRKSARYVGEQSIQLHGGMGMTDELRLGHYFKRMTAVAVLMGPAELQLHRERALQDFHLGVTYHVPKH